MHLHNLGQIKKLVLKTLAIQNSKDISIIQTILGECEEAFHSGTVKAVTFRLWGNMMGYVGYDRDTIISVLNLAGYNTKETSCGGGNRDWQDYTVTLRKSGTFEGCSPTIKNIVIPTPEGYSLYP